MDYGNNETNQCGNKVYRPWVGATQRLVLECYVLKNCTCKFWEINRGHWKLDGLLNIDREKLRGGEEKKGT